jgi:Fur family transcriptional regulator, zinc uptake regulator
MSEAGKLTRNQALVLAELAKAEGPVSAYTLLDRLREHGFRAPLQVYRALEMLTKAGLVHRLESMNAFVACAGGEHHGHAHGMTAFAICETCGQVSEFSDRLVSERLEDWVSASGFRPSRAVIEFRGLCAGCSAKAA